MICKIVSFLTVGVCLVFCFPSSGTADVVDIGVIDGEDYFYDITNDRTWVDHTFAINLTYEVAEAAVTSLGLTFADSTQMFDLFSSIGTSGAGLYQNVNAITNSQTPHGSIIIGWMISPLPALADYGTYEIGNMDIHQAVGRSSNQPLAFFNHSVWASTPGDLRNSIPEPGSVVVLSCVAITLLVRRKR